PLDVLLHAVVGRHRICAEDVAASRLAARESRCAARAKRGNEVRVKGRVECSKGEIVGLRCQPLDGQVEIAIECTLDRTVERQLSSYSRGRRRNSWSRLCLYFGGAGGLRFSKLLCGFASDLINACRFRSCLCRRGGWVHYRKCEDCQKGTRSLHGSL